MIPFGATFFQFIEYSLNAIRLAALSHVCWQSLSLLEKDGISSLLEMLGGVFCSGCLVL